MPRNESARARAERFERQAQREKETKAQAQQVQGDIQEQYDDDDGDQEMLNVKREVSVEAPIGESVIQRNLRIGKRHNRINERTRKPMNKYKEDKFDREIRWMFFLNLRHENEGTKDAVIQAVEPQLDPMSYQYEDLWKAIMGKVNHLRGGTVGYLKAHVSDMLKLDAINNGRLASLNAHAELAAFFQSIYSVSKFLEVFYFVQSIVDLRNQSPLALYYTKSLYANACAKTKLHLDWLETETAYNRAVELQKRRERALVAKASKTAANSYEEVAIASDDLFVAGDATGTVTAETERPSITRQETAVTSPEAAPATVDLTQPEPEPIVIPSFDKMSPHNREGLTVYLNNFPLAPQFAQVTRKEFKEKLAKKTKKPKAEPTHVAVGLDNLFFDGEPPKPSAK